MRDNFFVRTLRSRRDDDRGFAMVAGVVIGAVGLLLVTSVLATSTHLTNATVRSRNWNLAFQVAEAGVERAVAELTRDMLYAGTADATVQVPGGEFVVKVTTPEPGWRVIDSTGYVPSRAHPHPMRRRLEVTYAPARSFEYALFSQSSLNVKNNGGVVGDVFANEAILVENNSTVKGSVVSATGTVYVDNNAKIQKDGDTGGSIYSGGYHASDLWGIYIDNNAIVEGDARAEVQDCANTVVGSRQAYNLINRGTIMGRAVAGGLISGDAGGGRQSLTCEPNQPTQDLPEYHFDPSMYPDIRYYSSASDFNSLTGQYLTGTHRVDDPAGLIELQYKTITGDFTLITTSRVHYGNNGGSVPFFQGSASAQIEIIVLNTSIDPPAIDIENQLALPDPSPSLLIYSTGMIDVKNNGDTNGAVYAGFLNIKNNLNVTYDPRVERSLGFGDRRLERASFVELKVL